ncbi:MAG TPA: hypothetical protein VF901_27715 [Bradyrhizobium sp.]
MEYSGADEFVLGFGRSQSAAREDAMNYSSAAERAIEAVNRLLIAAMTLAWTSALDHQHALPPQEEEGDADDACLEREHSSAPDCAGKQH